MRVQHNITALNTANMLNKQQNINSKHLEKLSSGFKINRAGDDAAGLAISEKMRSQIRGLSTASKNAQDAISLIQTAEGAAASIHDMLQRGRELAIQAANDTLTDEDRIEVNKELTQLRLQIDKVANDTEFNTKKLLNKGSTSSEKSQLISTIKERLTNWIDDSLTVIKDNLGLDITFGSPKDMNVEFYEDSAGPAAASMGTADGGTTLTLRINMSKVNDIYNANDEGFGQVDALIAHEIVHALQFTKMPETLTGGIDTWFIEGLATAIQGGNPFLNGLTPKSNATIPTDHSWSGDYGSAYAAVMTLHEITTGGLSAIVDELEAGKTLSEAIAATTQVDTGEISNVSNFTGANAAIDFALWFNTSGDVDDYINNSIDFNNPIGTIHRDQGTIRTDVTSFESIIPNNTTLENGAPFNLIYSNTENIGEAITFHIGANTNQNIQINTVDMTAAGLSIKSADLSTRSNSEKAIEIIDSAIRIVSSIRSTFGSVQNRLEHTISNLYSSEENLTSAESRIRDVDMAKEMMNFTKSNILTQAAQSMLSQANMQPQSILQLLA